MLSDKKYGLFEDSLENLKALVPLASTVEGVKFEGPGRKVSAILTMAGLAGEFIEHIEGLEASLRDAQAALTELLTILPHLVRLADRKGVDLSEQPWIDRAQTYIDIYEGRTDDLQA